MAAYAGLGAAQREPIVGGVDRQVFCRGNEVRRGWLGAEETVKERGPQPVDVAPRRSVLASHRHGEEREEWRTVSEGQRGASKEMYVVVGRVQKRKPWGAWEVWRRWREHVTLTAGSLRCSKKTWLCRPATNDTRDSTLCTV